MTYLFPFHNLILTVPSEPPSNMEAVLLNSTAVYLKWKAPANNTINGKVLTKNKML